MVRRYPSTNSATSFTVADAKNFALVVIANTATASGNFANRSAYFLVVVEVLFDADYEFWLVAFQRLAESRLESVEDIHTRVIADGRSEIAQRLGNRSSPIGSTRTMGGGRGQYREKIPGVQFAFSRSIMRHKYAGRRGTYPAHKTIAGPSVTSDTGRKWSRRKVSGYRVARRFLIGEGLAVLEMAYVEVRMQIPISEWQCGDRQMRGVLERLKR
jgi:hypothetical protein